MPTEVQAAVLYQVGDPLEIETVEIDDPAPDEIRVGVAGSGLCHSDLHVMDGSLPAVSLPAVLGHEAAGVSAPGADAREPHAGHRDRHHQPHRGPDLYRRVCLRAP